MILVHKKGEYIIQVWGGKGTRRNPPHSHHQQQLQSALKKILGMVQTVVKCPASMWQLKKWFLERTLRKDRWVMVRRPSAK
jgi:hypothetical protein